MHNIILTCEAWVWIERITSHNTSHILLLGWPARTRFSTPIHWKPVRPDSAVSFFPHFCFSLFTRFAVFEASHQYTCHNPRCYIIFRRVRGASLPKTRLWGTETSPKEYEKTTRVRYKYIYIYIRHNSDSPSFNLKVARNILCYAVF